VEGLVSGLDEARGISLDVPRGKMYWVDEFQHKVQRANLDGSNVEDLVTSVTSGIVNPVGFALDLVADKMYWSDVATKKIQRANLDGSNIEDYVTTGLNNVRFLAVAPVPEPSSLIVWSLIGLSFAGVRWCRRRKRA
jgi:hypothetical protein